MTCRNYCIIGTLHNDSIVSHILRRIIVYAPIHYKIFYTISRLEAAYARCQNNLRRPASHLTYLSAQAAVA